MGQYARPFLPFVLALCLGLIPFSSDAGAGPQAKAKTTTSLDGAEARRLFRQRLLPLLKQKCLACHGDDPDDIKGEFSMRSRAVLISFSMSSWLMVLPA